MIRTRIGLLLAILVLLGFLSLTACSGGGDSVSVNSSTLSSDASLANFEATGLDLSPQFTADNTSYSATVGISITAIAVTISSGNNQTTIKIDGVTVDSGAPHTVNLPVGQTQIVVEVTAEDGITTKTYTLTITRPGVGLTPASSNLYSGHTATLTVLLANPASADTLVTLGSSDETAVSLSTPSVTLASGENRKDFQVNSIAAETANLTITATLGDDTASATVNVVGALCGDGIVEFGEECDDQNANLNDGCSNCRIDTGWNCVGALSLCTTTCGDGTVAAGIEMCDDGNTDGGDGCSSACNIENGWDCAASPSVCSSICGDGIVTSTEQCDDGNQDDNDYCSNTCLEVSHDCDDGLACTADSFDLTSHTCQHVPNDALCDDGNPCTANTCDAEEGCLHPPDALNGTSCDDGNACTANDLCNNSTCSGTPKSCDDGQVCTSDSCDAGTGNCLYTQAADGQFCGGGMVCTNGVCQSLCTDNVRNGDETAVDCGGSCLPCATGLGCAQAADCDSGVCTGGICQAPTCSDHVTNGSETALDCGGSCGPCGDGSICESATDCQSNVCMDGICQSPSCSDGVKNGVETAVDCGNGCLPCSTGSGCDSVEDCLSGVCTGGVCQAPTCTDGVMNGTESYLDCGGSCAPCVDGSTCAADIDCTSNACVGGTCQALTCSNSITDGDESDLDCGGSCSPCTTGNNCSSGADCLDQVCMWGFCNAPSCTDGLMNGTETGVDCGGICESCCPSCGWPTF
jgi:cysteine-rich repeat protein